MVKLFTVEQIRAWDEYTILNEPIASIDLMERASQSFVNWFVTNYSKEQTIYIFCGPGNNGGDGLAISRLLEIKGYHVNSFIINPKNKLSKDCEINYNKLNHCTTLNDINTIKEISFQLDNIIIDALFGSGLSRPLSGFFNDIVASLNTVNCIKLAVDIPSGQYCDTYNSNNDTIFNADHILTFQTPKRSFFFQEKNHPKFTLLNIGLSTQYHDSTQCNWYMANDLNETLSFASITNYTSISIEQYEAIFKTPFNTFKAINDCIQLAATKQESIIIKEHFFFLITPQKQVFIFN